MFSLFLQNWIKLFKCFEKLTQCAMKYNYMYNICFPKDIISVELSGFLKKKSCLLLKKCCQEVTMLLIGICLKTCTEGSDFRMHMCICSVWMKPRVHLAAELCINNLYYLTDRQSWFKRQTFIQHISAVFATETKNISVFSLYWMDFSNNFS